MNERIYELAEQCTTSCVDGRGVELNEIDVEKFAELIIRECAELVDCAISDGGVDGRMIKEHFGVEL